MATPIAASLVGTPTPSTTHHPSSRAGVGGLAILRTRLCTRRTRCSQWRRQRCLPVRWASSHGELPRRALAALHAQRLASPNVADGICARTSKTETHVWSWHGADHDGHPTIDERQFWRARAATVATQRSAQFGHRRRHDVGRWWTTTTTARLSPGWWSTAWWSVSVAANNRRRTTTSSSSSSSSTTTTTAQLDQWFDTRWPPHGPTVDKWTGRKWSRPACQRSRPGNATVVCSAQVVTLSDLVTAAHETVDSGHRCYRHHHHRIHCIVTVVSLLHVIDVFIILPLTPCIATLQLVLSLSRPITITITDRRPTWPSSIVRIVPKGNISNNAIIAFINVLVRSIVRYRKTQNQRWDSLSLCQKLHCRNRLTNYSYN